MQYQREPGYGGLCWWGSWGCFAKASAIYRVLVCGCGGFVGWWGVAVLFVTTAIAAKMEIHRGSAGVQTEEKETVTWRGQCAGGGEDKRRKARTARTARKARRARRARRARIGTWSAWRAYSFSSVKGVEGWCVVAGRLRSARRAPHRQYTPLPIGTPLGPRGPHRSGSVRRASCRLRVTAAWVRARRASLRQFAPVCASLRQFAPVCASLRQFAPVCASLRQFAPVCASLQWGHGARSTAPKHDSRPDHHRVRRRELRCDAQAQRGSSTTRALNVRG